jgi:hypothetical protein
LAVGAGRDFILRAEEPVDVVTKDDAVLLALYRCLSTSQRALLWHMAAYMGTAATADRWNASTGCTYRLTSPDRTADAQKQPEAACMARMSLAHLRRRHAPLMPATSEPATYHLRCSVIGAIIENLAAARHLQMTEELERRS